MALLGFLKKAFSSSESKSYINSQYFPDDKIKLKVSRSGGLEVANPIDLLFTPEEKQEIMREARRKALAYQAFERLNMKKAKEPENLSNLSYMGMKFYNVDLALAGRSGILYAKYKYQLELRGVNSEDYPFVQRISDLRVTVKAIDAR